MAVLLMHSNRMLTWVDVYIYKDTPEHQEWLLDIT